LTCCLICRDCPTAPRMGCAIEPAASTRRGGSIGGQPARGPHARTGAWLAMRRLLEPKDGKALLERVSPALVSVLLVIHVGVVARSRTRPIIFLITNRGRCYPGCTSARIMVGWWHTSQYGYGRQHQASDGEDAVGVCQVHVRSRAHFSGTDVVGTGVEAHSTGTPRTICESAAIRTLRCGRLRATGAYSTKVPGEWHGSATTREETSRRC